MLLNQEIRGITSWMKNYARDAKKDGYVCGISGGIDSALVTALSVDSVSKDNTFGVLMPCESSQDSAVDAEILAQNLEIPYKTVNFKNSFDHLCRNINTASSIANNFMAKGNLKARMRMSILYAIAEAKNYLVLGTGNKSELMVGYGTKGGDDFCDIFPVGDYYKHEIYQLASFFPEIPKNTVNKPPTADLWPGQKDEIEMQISYNKLDEILLALETMNIKQLDTLDIETVEKVQNMIKNTEHKRHMPPMYIRER